MCAILQAEVDTWKEMTLAMTLEYLAELRSQFGIFEMNVRGFVCHMIQNCIYKHGQFATLYFALGLDGDAPYDAPFPNPIYAELHETKHHETP